MTSVFQLYGRPLTEDSYLPPLRITGTLEVYTAGEPYEGRLQIIDSIGKCVVDIVESNLPPGSYAFVDNFTKEIVLRWPAYAPPEAKAHGVPNGDFEKGDDGSWRLGTGWSIVRSAAAETGMYSAIYQNQRGSQWIESNRVPYTPGQSITASGRFQQGASSAGNVVGNILLIWCDKSGNMIPGGEGVSWSSGNVVSSGSKGAWHTSSVTAFSNHPSVSTVSVGFNSTRKKQNHLCRVDNLTWNHEYSVGTDSVLDFTVTFKVTDSANRIAYWTGVVGEHVLFFTSRPYGVLMPAEGIQSIALPNSLSLRPPPVLDFVDAFSPIHPSITGGELRSPLQSYSTVTDFIASLHPNITGGELRTILKGYEVAHENISSAVTIIGGMLVTPLINTTIPVENISSAVTITGGTLA